MSTFDDLFAPAQDKIYDVFGTSATYNGAEVTVCIDDNYNSSEGSPGIDSPFLVIRVRLDDISSPRAGDTVVVRGDTWHVSGRPEHDGLEWILTLELQVRSQTVGV